MPYTGAGSDVENHMALLVRSVAEELKLPLLQIAREAELYNQQDSIISGLNRIQTSADMALTLVDSYLLGLELNDEQTKLELEPVSISSILIDTTHTLSGFAKNYDIDLEMVSSGKYGPVMTHTIGIKAALLSLGYSLITASQDTVGRQRIVLGVHRSSKGLVTGVYGDFNNLARKQLRQAQALYGRTRQPFRALSGNSAAGVFVADMILKSMQSSLSLSRHDHKIGLAATLQPSQQLTLV